MCVLRALFSAEFQDTFKGATGVLDHFLHARHTQVIDRLFPSVLGLDIHTDGPSDLFLGVSQIQQEEFPLSPVEDESLTGDGIPSAFPFKLVHKSRLFLDEPPTNPNARSVHARGVVAHDALVITHRHSTETNLEIGIPHPTGTAHATLAPCAGLQHDRYRQLWPSRLLVMSRLMVRTTMTVMLLLLLLLLLILRRRMLVWRIMKRRWRIHWSMVSMSGGVVGIHVRVLGVVQCVGWV